jgi:PAS domain S-box-containing protein
MGMSQATPHSGRSPEARGLRELEALLAEETKERRRLQSQLDLRNSALDSASTHFMILDVTERRWKIVYANRAVATDHGYEPAELLGQDPVSLTPFAENTEAFKRLSAAIRAGDSLSTELVSHRKNGATLHLGMFMTPVRHTIPGVLYYLAIGADITVRLAQESERRRLQEQLYSEMQERERMGIELRLAQKLESVGRLAAGIAHEINTPTQYIGDSVLFIESAYRDLERLRTVYVDALHELGEHDPAQTALQRVKEAEATLDLAFLENETPKAFERTMEGVRRVASIVRAMKEFAHPDSAEQNPADLNHAIETTLLVAHNEYKYTAKIDTHFGELPDIMCNVGELNQVFLNLIVNAAHTIAESGKDVETGRITITTGAVGAYVEIDVIDNGAGIPEENLEKIFDPFFTTKPVGRGTGQGLAITRAIVIEKHAGAIEVHSEVGTGTRFSLRLPIAGRRVSEGI